MKDKPENPQEVDWISVDDQLPEILDWILCSNNKDQWTDFAEIMTDGHGKKVFWNRECEIYPTHWNTLPEPPDAMLAERSKSNE